MGHQPEVYLDSSVACTTVTIVYLDRCGNWQAPYQIKHVTCIVPVQPVHLHLKLTEQQLEAPMQSIVLD